METLEKECNCRFFQKPIYHHGVRKTDAFQWMCPIHGQKEKRFDGPNSDMHLPKNWNKVDGVDFNPGSDSSDDRGWEREFRRKFAYFAGRPMSGSLELTHNNVRDFIREHLQQERAKGREEGFKISYDSGFEAGKKEVLEQISKLT